MATPDVVQPIVAADLPCALTLPLSSKRGALVATAAAAARDAAVSADAVAIGPGLTTSVAPFLRRFLKGLERPLVVDADALNALAGEPALLDDLGAPCVLTPHPGEASRLLGRAVPSSREGRLRAAAEIADRFGAVVLLKGAGTIVCDGEHWYFNRTGNPGMATGGSGDVLTGLLAARLAAGADPFTAACQAALIHGRAGDLAAAAVGEGGCIATDLVASLPAALDGYTESAPRRRTKEPQKGSEGSGSRRGSRRTR